MSNLKLENSFLSAEINAENGNLVSIKGKDGDEIISDSFLQYGIGEDIYRLPFIDEQNYSVSPIGESSVTSDSSKISIKVENEILTINLTYNLPENSPLLKMSIEVSGKGESKHLGYISLPNFVFTDDFAVSFEDEEDLYFDGEELTNGKELPCWRVLFKENRNNGAILAARSKYNMSKFQILEKGFRIFPHLMVNYDTNTILHNVLLPVDKDTSWNADFELGPWQRDSHQEIIEKAELNREVSVISEELTGERNAVPADLLYTTEKLVDLNNYKEEFDPDNWRKVKLPCCQSEYTLFSGSSVKPAPITFNPELEGFYKIFVGIANGNGIKVKIDGDEFPTYRSRPNTLGGSSPVDLNDNPKVTIESLNHHISSPFHLCLNGPQQAEEVYIYTKDLTDKSIELSRYPNAFSSCAIDYVRFEKASDAEAELAKSAGGTPPTELSGFVDTPDLNMRLDVDDPDPEVYVSNVWEHTKCGIKKIYWRIDGQCSDFPAKTNTMRYISAKTHGVYNPRSKAYGKILKKVDMLRLTVDAGNKYGADIYGWMRFNNYGGNVQSDFFKNNPQFHEESENTYRANKLCLAFPEVRKHKIDILVEACKYGLKGINLGFLRHPPIFMYHPVLVEGYREKYGKLPPRDEKKGDNTHGKSLPTDSEEHRQWYQYRADFMNKFMEELKAELKANNLEDIKLSCWVRPNHCLFDGIDLPYWMENKLIDEVVVQSYQMGGKFKEIYAVIPEWKDMIQKHIPLIRGYWYQNVNITKADFDKAIAEGYDGVCTYESNEAVLDTKWIEIYDELRK
ncbi:MAG: family 10 glycosylhydrolase [Planctomycetota bacterium]|jgi:hypothetical protein